MPELSRPTKWRGLELIAVRDRHARDMSMTAMMESLAVVKLASWSCKWYAHFGPWK